MKKLVIELDRVSKRYGEVEAVKDVSLAIPAGQLFGLIGHNGAGKSTLFRMMLGLIGATAGRICINGQSVRGAAFREVRRRIGYLPENVVLYDNLTGLETLQFFARMKQIDPQLNLRECLTILDRVGLADAAGRRVKGFSKGMRQRLGFAQALLGSPALLFLDEPTNGLDPEAIRAFYQTLADLRHGGATVILTSHILTEIQERVDGIAVLKSGCLQAFGSVQALREQVDLPLRITLQARAGALDPLLAKLAQAGLSARRRDVDGIGFECPRGDKMRLLQLLSGWQTELADLQIREPSLEDIFLGYNHAA